MGTGARALAHRLLLLLVAAFVPHGPVVVGLDDTIERRRGKCITAKGIYRDPVRSSRGHFVKASVLRWLCVMLLAPVPWAGCVWGLPFLTVVTRLRLDACLCDPPPPRRPRTRGRPPVKGARLPSLAERLRNQRTPWRRVAIDGWYGRRTRRLEIATGTALWHP